MDLQKFCLELPKIELHAHLNGSLSRSTMSQLKKYLADTGIDDETNAFFDEFLIDAGDKRSLSDCFEVFGIAHSLTIRPEALAVATTNTLQEFQEDGCCYLELRTTPRDTPYMNKKEYIETIIQAMQKSSIHLTMLSKLIISINRSSPIIEAQEITAIAIECFKRYPDIVVGIEIGGNPLVGDFKEFIPVLTEAREAGLKVALHCGEVSNPEEVLDMLNFKPDRIGHGVCIHPKFGGNNDTWKSLCELKIPVEVCLTSNVNTKSTPDYESHHFKELHEAGIPVILCTDDKGVFQTSLSQEYRLCAESFHMTQSQLARLSLNACNHVFATDARKILNDKLLNFINKNAL